MITAGTSGIGLAAAQRFVAAGAFVDIFGRRQEETGQDGRLESRRRFSSGRAMRPSRHARSVAGSELLVDGGMCSV